MKHLLFFGVAFVFSLALFLPLVSSQESDWINLGNGIIKYEQSNDAYNETFYLAESTNSEESYQVSIVQQSDLDGVVHVSVLKKLREWKEQGVETVNYGGADLYFPESKRLYWISGQYAIVVNGPVSGDKFSKKIMTFLLEKYPYTSVESKVNQYIKEMERIVSESNLPTTYPVPDGYVQTTRVGIEQNGGFDIITFTGKDGKIARLRLEESKDAFHMDDIISREIGNVQIKSIVNLPPLYHGSDVLGNFVAWQSVPFLVKVIYPEELPIDFVEFFLDSFPLKEYGEGDRLLQNEKVNLLYTSDVFENPFDYVNLIFNSRESSIECNQQNSPIKGEDAVQQILKSANYPITSKILADIKSGCSREGRYLPPVIPLPYDIAICVSEWKNILTANNVPIIDFDISQECLIESYSKEKFLEKGGNQSDYLQLLAKRKPKVVELLRERRAPRQRCTETEDNQIINCEMVNQVIEPTHEVLQDGRVFSETSSEYDKFKAENERTLKYEEKMVLINGAEILSREEVKVSNGKLVVNDKVIGIFPDGLNEEITSDTRVASVTVSGNGKEYVISAVRPSKLLFLIPVDLPFDTLVNTASGDYRIDRPFWSFLTT